MQEVIKLTLEECRAIIKENGPNFRVPQGRADFPLIFIALQNLEILELVLASGANINYEVGHIGPFTLACMQQRSLSIIDTLLRYGANVNEIVYGTRTPLDWVVDHREVDESVAKRLIDAGAKSATIPLPDSICDFIEARESCRCAAVSFIKLHHRSTSPFMYQDKNVIILIAKHIWSFRMTL